MLLVNLFFLSLCTATTTKNKKQRLEVYERVLFDLNPELIDIICFHLPRIQDVASLSLVQKKQSCVREFMAKASNITSHCGEATSNLVFKNPSYIFQPDTRFVHWDHDCINMLSKFLVYSSTLGSNYRIDHVDVYIDFRLNDNNNVQEIELSFKHLARLLHSNLLGNIRLFASSEILEHHLIDVLRASNQYNVTLYQVTDIEASYINHLSEFPNIYSYVSDNCNNLHKRFFPIHIQHIYCTDFEHVAKRLSVYPQIVEIDTRLIESEHLRFFEALPRIKQIILNIDLHEDIILQNLSRWRGSVLFKVKELNLKNLNFGTIEVS